MGNEDTYSSRFVTVQLEKLADEIICFAFPNAAQVRSKPRVETHGHERPLNRFADVA